MFTKAELIDAIDTLEDGKHTVQNCEKLAALYIVLDHLYPEGKKMSEGYSLTNKIETVIGDYGDSKFLKAVSGKSSKEIWLLMDELIEALTVLDPRLISSFFEKLNNIK